MKKALGYPVVILAAALLSSCGNTVRDTASETSAVTAAEATEKTQPEPVVIAKSSYGNPVTGFDGEGDLTYGGDPSALKYTLDEQAISRMLSEMNYPESLVPKSDKQE